jgi:hypothetical protein
MATHSPREFYRVHHRDSFTFYHHGTGFQTRESYQFGRLSPPQWLNKQRFQAHVAGAIPVDRFVTPFISMFDNFTRAYDLALTWQNKGYQNVFIARIRPGRLDAIEIELQFQHGTISLPAWMSDGVIVIATMDVRVYLGMEEGRSDMAEWFVVEDIPAEWISIVEDVSIEAVPIGLSGKG